VATEFPAAGADKVAARLAELAKSTVYVLPPSGAAAAAEPAGYKEAVEAGASALNEHRYADALAALDKAAAINAKSARVLALRSMAHSGLGELAAARRDDDLALGLDPRDENALLAKGDLAARDGRWTAAIVAYTQAADAAAGDTVPRVRRILAYEAMHDDASALDDSDDALKAAPHDQRLHRLRGLVLARLKRTDEAVAEAKEITAFDPKDGELQLSSAEVFASAGRKAQAMAAMDRALALQPTAANYVARAEFRDPTDTDGAEQDAQAALKLDPKFRSAMVTMAFVEQRRRRFAEAKVWYDRLLAAHPDDEEIIATRASLELQLGQTAQAKADFAQVRQLGASQPESLNALCWNAATKNFDLAQALSDCDLAIKLAPRAADILDSRAFVLLRLGRDDDAISQYDTAIDLDSGHPSSFYGRSLAERRRGRVADADRDLAAALKIDKGIADEFKGYGVTK
jgi:tetratricopeptide (TPR) repeat protein